MAKYSRAAMLLSLCVGFNAWAIPAQYSPGASGYLCRADLMERTQNYQGASDQLTQALNLKAPLPENCTGEEELALMRSLLLTGETANMRALYKQFQQQYPASHISNEAKALLADSYFFEHDWNRALEIYSDLQIRVLPSPVMQGTLYRMALSQLHAGKLEEAAGSFASLLGEAEYGDVSRFYLAYIYYLQEDYRRALTDLRALPQSVAADMGADFYIAQILFAGGKYSELLAMKNSLLTAAAKIDGKPDGETEAWRLLGESAHASGRQQDAREWLTRHAGMHPDGGELSARYLLGADEYALGNYSKATEWLTPVAEEHSVMGQSALLYLGQAAAKTGDYSAAAIYFDRASRLDLDRELTQTALYNYAAAIARGGNVPFGSATKLLEEFVSRFPDSPYTASADEYLATGYYREHRYAEALSRISRIKAPSQQVRRLEQLCEYSLGCDLLAAGRTSEALSHLQKASTMQADQQVATDAALWLADCYYKQKNYKQALAAYNSFLTRIPASDHRRQTALYNKAYTQFQLGQYADARKSFESVTSRDLGAELLADATLRIADCYNYTGAVNSALETYRRASAMQSNGKNDYAIFQAANMLGVLGRNSEKAAMLENLLKEQPQSSWASSALAELAEARQASGDIDGARQAIDRLRSSYPESEQLRAASLSIADALADKGRTQEAIEAYEKVVRSWPTSPQARVAAENLQNICAEAGQLDRFLAFIKSVPGAPQPDPDRVAALAYQQALAAVEKNPADLTPLENYVKSYPRSASAPDALAELADAALSAGDSDKALDFAERILLHYPDSQSVPAAMIIKGSILSLRGDKQGASGVYISLLGKYGNTYARQAYAGLLNNSTDPAKVITYSRKLMQLPDLPAEDRLMATLRLGDALMQTGSYDEAAATLAPLTSDTRTATGGQAVVTLAQVCLKQNNPAKAESLMSEFTKHGCDDFYWLARGYITLADALHIQGRDKLARQYLEALRQNYPDADDEIGHLIEIRLSQFK